MKEANQRFVSFIAPLRNQITANQTPTLLSLMAGESSPSNNVVAALVNASVPVEIENEILALIKHFLRYFICPLTLVRGLCGQLYDSSSFPFGI